MKKLILTLSAVLLFSVTGWAKDMQPASTAPETPDTPDATVSTQETLKSTPEASADTKTSTTDPVAAPSETALTPTDMVAEKPKHSFGHKLLLYIPNRLLDVFDIVRLRIRVGPGFALGGRLTKPLSFFFGGYGTVFVGLPGPRLEPIVKLPFGLENYGGLSLSLLDSTNEGKFDPDYSPTEIGYSVQVLIIGADVDVDPIEVLDFATGFLFIDIREDDL
jgi:hypothetical protein